MGVCAGMIVECTCLLHPIDPVPGGYKELIEMQRGNFSQ